jgi:copper chaperone CopZ
MSHRIDVLYFAGCPNHEPTVEMAQRLVDELKLDAVVEEVELTDPAQATPLRFLGSPTVQIDGVDIEPAARDLTDFAMSCRIYQTPDGLPTERMFLDALGLSDLASPQESAGAHDISNRAGALATGGSVVTAMLSSACCWLPLLLLAFGASAAGVGAFFEQWRPYFITLSVVMLGTGFYFAYFRASACKDGCCSTRARRGQLINRAMLWTSSVVVLAFVMFPKYGASLIESIQSRTATEQSIAATDAAATGDVYVFEVEGMTCEACAVTLKSQLAKIPGVTSAQVNYADKTARVNADDPAVLGQVEEIGKSLGYAVSPVPQENDPQEQAP